MRIVLHALILLASLVVIAMAMVLWDATGRAGYTKYFDPERAAATQEAEESDSIGDLFGEAGAEVESVDRIKNRFEFGLAPSGPDKHIASVATIAGPAAFAALLSLVLLVVDFRGRRGASASSTAA